MLLVSISRAKWYVGYKDADNGNGSDSDSGDSDSDDDDNSEYGFPG